MSTFAFTLIGGQTIVGRGLDHQDRPTDLGYQYLLSELRFIVETDEENGSPEILGPTTHWC